MVIGKHTHKYGITILKILELEYSWRTKSCLGRIFINLGWAIFVLWRIQSDQCKYVSAIFHCCIHTFLCLNDLGMNWFLPTMVSKPDLSINFIYGSWEKIGAFWFKHYFFKLFVWAFLELINLELYVINLKKNWLDQFSPIWLALPKVLNPIIMVIFCFLIH